MSDAKNNKPLVIWRIVDGKPGHENQTLGLCNALQELIQAQRFDISAGGKAAHFFDWIMRRFPQGVGLPDPDLVVGAGHGAHFAMLAARRACGGRSVVLMKPSLPLTFFDLCLIPVHDDVSAANVLWTEGVLNTIRPCKGDAGNQTLILVGGESPHFRWNNESIIRQVLMVVDHAAGKRCVVTTSRRTPSPFVDSLERVKPVNLEIIPWEETRPGWVSEQLCVSHSVWVTQDSVSMIFEAVTSGRPVGIFQLSLENQSRVSRSIELLSGQGMITMFDNWRESGSLKVPSIEFNESARCAKWISDKWLNAD